MQINFFQEFNESEFYIIYCIFSIREGFKKKKKVEISTFGSGPPLPLEVEKNTQNVGRHTWNVSRYTQNVGRDTRNFGCDMVFPA